MRIFHIEGDQATELAGGAGELPAAGYIWVSTTRAEFEGELAPLQALLQRWAGGQIVDLHVSDLLNEQLRSNYDYTSWYDLLVFRRLATAIPPEAIADDGRAEAEGALAVPIDTNPVGFVLFDRVLLTVHPVDGTMRDYFANRLRQNAAGTEGRNSGRMPPNAADLMLRIVNHIVDSYLELRRALTRQLEFLERELFTPRSGSTDWHVLLGSRNVLHSLEETCEDQRAAIVEWIDALAEWPPAAEGVAQQERELLKVRSRDVLEHIERVLTHVRRLESSAETAVQIHFSAQGNRTNEIMRTLTVLTAIFLPLNLVTGFFGMNFEALPLIHSPKGFWVTACAMLLIGVLLSAYFWRKRYLGRQGTR